MPISKTPRKNGKKIRNIVTFYFYYDEKGRKVTISADKYREMKRVCTESLKRNSETGKLEMVKNGTVKVPVYKNTIKIKNTVSSQLLNQI